MEGQGYFRVAVFDHFLFPWIVIEVLREMWTAKSLIVYTYIEDQLKKIKHLRLQRDAENYRILGRASSYIVESKKSLMKIVNYLIKLKFCQSYSWLKAH